jgi:hypothetical protein
MRGRGISSLRSLAEKPLHYLLIAGVGISLAAQLTASWTRPTVACFGSVTTGTADRFRCSITYLGDGDVTIFGDIHLERRVVELKLNHRPETQE